MAAVIHIRVNPKLPRPICTEITGDKHCSDSVVCTIYGFKEEREARDFARQVKKLRRSRMPETGETNWKGKLKLLLTDVEEVQRAWNPPIHLAF